MRYPCFIKLTILICLSISLKAKAQSTKDSLRIIPYTINPDYPPGYIGGPERFNVFLKKNIRWPKSLPKTIGNLCTEVIIEEDGSLSNIAFLQPAGKNLQQEIIRVLNLSPKWSPGKIKIKKETEIRRSLYIIPFNYSAGKVSIPNLENQSMQDSVNNFQIFDHGIQTNPQFIGGEEGFGKFLRGHIRYPQLAKQKNVIGKVFIQFVVEQNGNLSHLQILRDPGMGLGDEAMRVFNMCPKWTPGFINGKPVRTLYTVPINFSLAE